MADLEALMPSSTVDDVIFDILDPDDLCRFRCVCKTAKAKIGRYYERRFSIVVLLLRFFNDTKQAKEFWSLMATTGMLISGSAAVQFFDRTYYPDSDLDIYLEESRAVEVGNWLVNAGYKYCPTKHSSPSTADGRVSKLPAGDTAVETFTSLTLPSYSGATMVLSFERVYRGKCLKVQLVATNCCPLQLILRFHSTVVLNLLSHNKAYSLYPMATFVERRGLIQVGLVDRDQTKAINKYVGRGWDITYNLEEDEDFDPMSSLSAGPRRLGDWRCWTIDLDPDDGLRSSDNLEANRWIVTLEAWEGNAVNACLFLSDRLEHGYLVAPSIHMRDVLRKIELIKSVKIDKKYLDEFCTNIFG